MLRILPLADGVILPQAKQESYFFNRVDPKRSFATYASWVDFQLSRPKISVSAQQILPRLQLPSFG